MKINENLDLWEMEEKLIDMFLNLSEDDLMSLYSDSIETGGGAVWIRQNGETIELDLHQDFGDSMFWYFCKRYFEDNPNDDYSEDDFALEDLHEYNDHLVDDYGWVKFNFGDSFYEDRCYVVLPPVVTQKQYYALEDLLDKCVEGEFLVLTPNSNINRYYDLTENSPRDIIKKIRKYFISGVLEENKINENWNNKDFTKDTYRRLKQGATNMKHKGLNETVLESMDHRLSLDDTWFEFSDDEVEDDIQHSNVYGGDSRYCKICGTVKNYDEDGFPYCVSCNEDKRLNSSKKNLEEAGGKRYYVTTYDMDSRSGPEEGGYTNYGWDASVSKHFSDLDKARSYMRSLIDEDDEIISEDENRLHLKDAYGNEYIIAIETSGKRGRTESPALTWAQAEFDYRPERPYFDKSGRRTYENPYKVAKDRKARKALIDEVNAKIDSARTTQDILDIISNIEYVPVYRDTSARFIAKYQELKGNEDSSTTPLQESFGEDEKIQALAQFLGCDVSDITPGYTHEFDVSNGESYYVVDEEEAEQLAREDIESLYDDLGLEAFTEYFRNWIIANALNQDWFEEAVRESTEAYVDDIAYEGDRLQEELLERGIITEDDIEEGYDVEDAKAQYVQFLMEDIDDYVEYCGFNFGWDWVSKVATDYHLIDMDAVAEECILVDGVAHFIARYDGDEIELENGLYAYRTN